MDTKSAMLWYADAIPALEPPPLHQVLSHCQLSDSHRLPVLDESSWWLLVTGWREGWRPSDKEGYRGHNMAAPLSRGIKVGQSVPWMISNSTFWGPIHWKYIYTHALSYIGRKWVRKGNTGLMWLSIRHLLCVGSWDRGLRKRGNYRGQHVNPSNTVLKYEFLDPSSSWFSVLFLQLYSHVLRFNRIVSVASIRNLAAHWILMGKLCL